MQGKTKLIAALGLMAGGLALALFFRRPPPGAPAESALAKPPVLRQSVHGSPQLSAATPQQPLASGEPGAPLRTAQTLPAPTVLAPLDRVVPPALPRTYPARPESLADWDGARAGAPLGLGSFRSVGLPEETRIHTITDGDSLPALAERYLGSAERWPEIFAANRHLLASPELLPIGLQLTVPLGPLPQAERSTGPANEPATGAPDGSAGGLPGGPARESSIEPSSPSLSDPSGELPGQPAAPAQPRGRLVPVDIGSGGS